MSNLLKSLRIAADPTRLRILLLLQGEGLSVAELQEILTMGQSTISTHLAQLKQAGLVEDRRVGKSSLYQLTDTAAKSPFTEILARAKDEIAEAPTDLSAMRRVLRKRQDKMRAFFDSVAGRLGRDYVPGKSWKSVADALLHLLPPLIIADLGSGEGGFALLLAQTAKRVIAVDSSEKMLEVGRGLAQRNSVRNVEFRQGDMEELPIDSASVDAVFFSQSLHHALHPDGALTEAHRILVPGGRVGHSRSGKASLRRSPRTLRRRVAGLFRGRTGIDAARAAASRAFTRQSSIKRPSLRISRQFSPLRTKPAPDPTTAALRLALTYLLANASSRGRTIEAARIAVGTMSMRNKSVCAETTCAAESHHSVAVNRRYRATASRFLLRTIKIAAHPHRSPTSTAAVQKFA